MPEAEEIESDASWTVDDACALYRIDDWGRGYFGINEAGHVCVKGEPGSDKVLDLHELVEGLVERGIQTPVLIRFSDILKHRLRAIRGAFDRAIEDRGYEGGYRCVYPIKVNQQRHMCEEILELSRSLGFGFEAGSRAELWAVLGMCADAPEVPIVCNGFKDAAMMRTIVLGQKLGRLILPVIERLPELEMLIIQAQRCGVQPMLGLRVKPSAMGAGRWEASSGPRSKFGLDLSQTLVAVDRLRELGLLDRVKMLHFHVGSQLCDITTLAPAITELTRLYARLVELGCGLDTINIGGGLAVEYDGSQSACESSKNYTLEEYASVVVKSIQQACDDAGIEHPTIVSESGRAMVAHSSVLVFDVLGVQRFAEDPEIDAARALVLEQDSQVEPLRQLIALWESLETGCGVDAIGIYHGAMRARDEAMQMFGLGGLGLRARAAVDRLYWAILRWVGEHALQMERVPEELAGFDELLSDTLFCNLSVFQSLPDAWAIGQVFPACPIHRLNEKPTRNAKLADMTCDSDGKLDRFPAKTGQRQTLATHEMVEGEAYRLGVFLTGAYQEVLGDLHNLFGDAHAVHVTIEDDGSWHLDELIRGDRIRDVLGYVQFDADQLVDGLRRQIEKATRDGVVDVAEGRELLEFYRQGLETSTYLQPELLDDPR